jgi:hypothetical protein
MKHGMVLHCSPLALPNQAHSLFTRAGVRCPNECAGAWVCNGLHQAASGHIQQAADVLCVCLRHGHPRHGASRCVTVLLLLPQVRKDHLLLALEKSESDRMQAEVKQAAAAPLVSWRLDQSVRDTTARYRLCLAARALQTNCSTMATVLAVSDPVGPCTELCSK